MLEQKDLKAIEMLLKSNNEQMKTFIEEKIGQSEERMKAHVDEKIGQSEERMKVHVDEKIGQSEERMKAHVEEKIEQSEERMKAHVDEKIGQSEERMKVHIGEKVVLSERFLLEEMERMHSSVDAKIDFLQRNISELTQYYKITKLESDNTALLLQMITKLQGEVEELKKKIA